MSLSKDPFIFLDNDLRLIVNHCGEELKKLHRKKIFITGGTGFFGKWILLALVHANYLYDLELDIIVLSRDPNKFKKSYNHFSRQKCIRLLKGDICSFDFSENDIDYIIHAATPASAQLNHDFPEKMLSINIEGTRNVIEFASKQASLKSVLYTSSGAVYGPYPEEIEQISEMDSCYINLSNSSSAYAEGKRVGELLFSIFSQKNNVPVKIARCFAFVGPFLPLDTHFAIGNFINDGIQNKDIIIKSDGSAVRSYLYAADLTIWLIKILMNGESCLPYNVGSNEGLSIKMLADNVLENFKGLKCLVMKEKELHTSTSKYLPNIDRAVNHLGVDVYTNLKDSINKTVNWHS